MFIGVRHDRRFRRVEGHGRSPFPGGHDMFGARERSNKKNVRSEDQLGFFFFFFLYYLERKSMMVEMPISSTSRCLSRSDASSGCKVYFFVSRQFCL